MKEILLATNNKGKVERFKKLISTFDADIVLHTPAELNIESEEVEEEGKTLSDNAELKARAYLGKVDIPILANDTGFWVEGDGLVEAPKRTALQGVKENKLTENEIANKLTEFWKEKAKKRGGKVDAAWIEDFVLITPNKSVHHTQSRREVILTDREFGIPHIQMPVRALYISKETNKPSIQHTEEEELLELKPITQALKELMVYITK